MDEELLRFVREALSSGTPRQEIAAILQRAGWPEPQVRAALAAYADLPFAMPVPRPRPYMSAREAFLYLVLFSTLYASAYHFGSLVFDLIDITFPDPAFDQWSYQRSDYSVRWSVSALIVAFPVFLYLSRVTGRQVARNPQARESRVRRWLTYLTLFVSASVLICDVMVLVYNALGGDLTSRFVLKVLTVAIIGGLVFGYYLRDLRTDEREAA
jgi:hypothetical protein